mgnify:CR=1 FL=1
MIFDVLSSLIIGVSAVRQVSFYLSVKKRGLIVMQMLLIAALTFIYGLLQGLFVRTAFALFSTVLMLGLCAVSLMRIITARHTTRFPRAPSAWRRSIWRTAYLKATRLSAC